MKSMYYLHFKKGFSVEVYTMDSKTTIKPPRIDASITGKERRRLYQKLYRELNPQKSREWSRNHYRRVVALRDGTSH